MRISHADHLATQTTTNMLLNQTLNLLLSAGYLYIS